MDAMVRSALVGVLVGLVMAGAWLLLRGELDAGRGAFAIAFGVAVAIVDYVRRRARMARTPGVRQATETSVEAP